MPIVKERMTFGRDSLMERAIADTPIQELFPDLASRQAHLYLRRQKIETKGWHRRHWFQEHFLMTNRCGFGQCTARQRREIHYDYDQDRTPWQED